MRLGARLNAPCEVAGLRVEHGFHVIVLADGSEIPTRAVIVASGARYRRLDVDGLERFEGAGVYYAATDLEARICSGFDVIVVGGGNSAGQAAIYMAQQKCHVSLVVAARLARRRRCRSTSSSASRPTTRIDVLTHTEVRALAGDTHLDARSRSSTTRRRTRRTVECSGLFCFIGAEPATGGSAVASRSTAAASSSPTVRCPTTSCTAPTSRRPRSAAVRDVAAGRVRGRRRAQGSLKRVAAAVGEGSSAVRSVHEYLATHT